MINRLTSASLAEALMACKLIHGYSVGIVMNSYHDADMLMRELKEQLSQTEGMDSISVSQRPREVRFDNGSRITAIYAGSNMRGYRFSQTLFDEKVLEDEAEFIEVLIRLPSCDTSYDHISTAPHSHTVLEICEEITTENERTHNEALNNFLGTFKINKQEDS